MARILALVSICFVVAGCELVADFDRSKIPVKDAGTHAGGAGAKSDAGKPDSGSPPGESDGGTETDGG